MPIASFSVGGSRRLGKVIGDAQIACRSTAMTLKPGHLIATGTPGGVGSACDPPLFRKIGVVMGIEIDQLGHVENRIVAEP